MTPNPGALVGLIPWCVMLLSIGLRNVVPLMGSAFGTIHGFTQRGCTGMTSALGEKFCEADGLKASAIALALTLLPVRPQIREKNVGSPVCVTCTATIGFTPNATAPVELQLLGLLPPASLERNVTETVPGAEPLIRF